MNAEGRLIFLVLNIDYSININTTDSKNWREGVCRSKEGISFLVIWKRRGNGIKGLVIFEVEYSLLKMKKRRPYKGSYEHIEK